MKVYKLYWRCFYTNEVFFLGEFNSISIAKATAAKYNKDYPAGDCFISIE